MVAFPRYPSIPTLRKRPEILAVKEVVATEKLHGTNFRVRFPDGLRSVDEVELGGRNEVFGTDGGEAFYGGRPVRWFREHPERLEAVLAAIRERGYSEVVVYGEVCGPGIQKGVRYTDDPDLIFRAFDVAVGENLLTRDRFVDLCEAAGLPRVPEVWRGEPSERAFDDLLEKPSLEAGRNGIDVDTRPRMEGVVIRSEPLLRNVFGEWLIVKHKSERFEEEARKSRKPRSGPAPGPLDDFVRTFVLRGRVVNALGRLRDAGEPVTDTMADMRSLAPAVVADLRTECAPEWRALTDAGFDDKRIGGAVTRELARLYRAMLVELQG